MATGTGKRINVNASAAGFKPGAARINASDASNRRVRPYMPSNTGGAQQEHSIKGTPAAASENVDRSPGPLNARANQSRGIAIAIRVAAEIRIPKTKAGQIIRT
jgi:hypothetical protein